MTVTITRKKSVKLSVGDTDTKIVRTATNTMMTVKMSSRQRRRKCLKHLLRPVLLLVVIKEISFHNTGIEEVIGMVIESRCMLVVDMDGGTNTRGGEFRINVTQTIGVLVAIAQ